MMDVPIEIQTKVDKIFIEHQSVFRQTVPLFEDNDMFQVFDKLMTDYLLKNEEEMKIKHMILLLAIGRALIEAGFDRNAVKQTQEAVVMKYALPKSSFTINLISVLSGILHIAMSEALAFFSF